MLLAKKWGILKKKKPESLVFAGLEISRDYYILLEVSYGYTNDITYYFIILLFIFIIIPILIFAIKTGVKEGILEAYSILKDK